MLCNYLQNVAAITYIFVLQLSTFLFYNKHQVLALCPERAEEPRGEGYPGPVRGWAGRNQGGHSRGIPEDGVPALHRPSGQKYHEVCVGQRP